VFVLATSDCYYEAMVAASIEERFSFITEYWRPRVVAELNGQEAKLVKFQGEFPWHHQDEMFLVWHGEMRVEFRDCVVSLRSGEYCVAPRRVEHRTCADEEAAVVPFRTRSYAQDRQRVTAAGESRL